MKHIRISLALALLLAAQATKAQTSFENNSSYLAKTSSFIVLTHDSSRLRIHLQCDNPAGERVQIAIRSENSELYNQVYTARSVVKTFDLSQLEDGQYSITVSRGRERVEKRILLQTATVSQRLQTID